MKFEAEVLAALRGIRDELAGIRAQLERFEPEPEPAEDAPPPECQHPDDQRMDFGTTDGQPDWLCKVCGFRTVRTDG